MTLHCPKCGNPLAVRGINLATGRRRTPRGGEGAICSGCGTPLTFEAADKIRLATPEEVADFDQVRLAGIQEAILAGHIKPLSERDDL